MRELERVKNAKPSKKRIFTESRLCSGEFLESEKWKHAEMDLSKATKKRQPLGTSQELGDWKGKEESIGGQDMKLAFERNKILDENPEEEGILL